MSFKTDLMVGLYECRRAGLAGFGFAPPGGGWGTNHDWEVDFVDISHCADAFRNMAPQPVGPPLNDPGGGKKTIGG